MSDFLLELSQNPTAKKLIEAAGLPIPLPAPLDRLKGPVSANVLQDAPAFVGGEGDLGEIIADTLLAAGVEPYVLGDKLLNQFKALSEKYHKKPTRLLLDEVPA